MNFDSEEVSLVSGDCNELGSLLKNRHGFTRSRAEVEADDLFDAFFERLKAATDIHAGSKTGESVFDPKTATTAA